MVWLCCCTSSFVVFSTSCYQLDSNLAYLGPHLRWENYRVSFCNKNSMVALVTRWCRDNIQVRRDGNMFTLFCSKFIQETAHKISPESPEFGMRFYKNKNISVSFFPDAVYNEIYSTESWVNHSFVRLQVAVDWRTISLDFFSQLLIR